MIPHQEHNVNKFVRIKTLLKRKIYLDKYEYVWYNNKVNNGMSPSGKAPDFDSGTRRFESGHPSQKSPRTKFGEIFTFSLFTLHFSLNSSEENFGEVISNSE